MCSIRRDLKNMYTPVGATAYEEIVKKKKISGRAWKKPKKPGLKNNIQKLRTFW